MKGIKCNGCGLMNAPTDQSCRRCKQRIGYVDPRSPRPQGRSFFVPVALLTILLVGGAIGLLFKRSFNAAAEQPKELIPSILPTPTPDEQEIKQIKYAQARINQLANAPVGKGIIDTRKIDADGRKAIRPALDEMQRKNIERAIRSGKEIERQIAESAIVGH